MIEIEIEHGVCRVCGHECGHQRRAVTITAPSDGMAAVDQQAWSTWAAGMARALAREGVTADSATLEAPPEIPTTSSDARQRASVERDFYRCHLTGDLVYRWSDARMVLVSGDAIRVMRHGMGPRLDEFVHPEVPS